MCLSAHRPPPGTRPPWYQTPPHSCLGPDLTLEGTWDQTGSDIIPFGRNMGPDGKWPHTSPREPQKRAVRILLKCCLVIFMFYCFIFAAAVKLFDLHLRQCRRCFYALPDGAFTASSVPRDAQLHGRASQISARKSTTGNVCLSVCTVVKL